MSDPIQFVPLAVDEPEREKFFERLAEHLAEHGVPETSAGPLAVGLMGIFQKAIDAGDMQAGIDKMNLERDLSEHFWLTHHPDSNMARTIRERRQMRGASPMPTFPTDPFGRASS